MTTKKASLPSPAELEILAVLWRRGPATVRDVHEALAPVKQVRYTTILKLMQIMADKGLVTRGGDPRRHIYQSSVDKEQVQRACVRDLAARAFDGNLESLIECVRSLQQKPSEELRK